MTIFTLEISVLFKYFQIFHEILTIFDEILANMWKINQMLLSVRIDEMRVVKFQRCVFAVGVVRKSDETINTQPL